MDPTSLRPSCDDLWAAALGVLDNGLRSTIDFDRSDKLEIVRELLQSADAAKAQCASKAWRLRRKSGATVNVRDLFAKVARWADRFKEIGDIAVQYDPAHASLPWAGVRFLLKSYSFVLESMSSIAELVCRYAFVEELLLRFSTAENETSPPSAAKELRRALVQLYARVLTYLARARAYYLQTTASCALLETSALEESFSAIAAAQSEADRCFQVASVQESKRIKILRWLSDEPYRKHHQLTKDGFLEGTGQWLLLDPVYARWKEESASSILWLHGIPGSGKSKLVPPPAYFYCSRNPAEPRRSDPESILASIARQLSCLQLGRPLLQPTVAAYNKHEEEGFPAESLRLQETRGLIVQLAGHYPTVTIILDALDECNPITRKDLLVTIESILRESSCLVKIFVSSRDDQDIVYKLQGYPNLELSSDRNSSDITNSIKQELRQKIIREVVSGAAGMFRWASLQLQALCDLKSDEAVLERIGRLPQTLEALYRELLQKINNYSSLADRQYASKGGKPSLKRSRRMNKDKPVFDAITEDVIEAAAGNEVSGEKVMALLLDRYGDQVTITEDVVTITEDVVKAAAGNKVSGEGVMALLLDRYGDQVRITNKIVSTIIGRFDSQVMALLLDRRRNQVTITEDVVKAAAGNEVTITEDVVKAAAGNCIMEKR
ncbi:hypothetical protein DL768_009821 [Monosporascus sp. mg162]|nr:hypothetical protein DL768_009821 [Monosporascus sp. mg162]